MIFNVFVYGFVMLIVGGLAWLIIKPKQSMPVAREIKPLFDLPQIQPVKQYARPVESELDEKLRRIERVLHQKYEAKADAAAIAEAQKLLSE